MLDFNTIREQSVMELINYKDNVQQLKDRPHRKIDDFALANTSIHTTYEYYCDVMDEQDKIIAFMNNTFVLFFFLLCGL